MVETLMAPQVQAHPFSPRSGSGRLSRSIIVRRTAGNRRLGVDLCESSKTVAGGKNGHSGCKNRLSRGDGKTSERSLVPRVQNTALGVHEHDRRDADPRVPQIVSGSDKTWLPWAQPRLTFFGFTCRGARQVARRSGKNCTRTHAAGRPDQGGATGHTATCFSQDKRDEASNRMRELGIPPSTSVPLPASISNPASRLSPRQLGDLQPVCTPEQKDVCSAPGSTRRTMAIRSRWSSRQCPRRVD